VKKLLAKQLAWIFVSAAALGCNAILDNDDPFLIEPAGEEPFDATTGDVPKGTKSPDAAGTPPVADDATSDAQSADVAVADRDGAEMADDAVPTPDTPTHDNGDATIPPPDTTTPPPDVTTPPPDATTPPPDTSTPPPDIITPRPDVTSDKTTSSDGPSRDADAASPPDVKDAGTEPPSPDVQEGGSNEAGTVDVTPPKADAADGCTPNPCGGCAELSQTPGAACGSCGTYACNADKNGVNCNNDPGLNACGGCGVLSGAPGAKCATCGAYVCSTDKTSVTCDHPDPLTVKQVAAGDGVTCALLTTGALRCWGKNDDGELGDDTTVSRSSPPAVNAVSNVSDLSWVSLGATHACAMRSGGEVRCWGDNSVGQLGTGTTTKVLNVKGPDVLGGTTGVSAMNNTSCAVLGTGSVRCWGSGEMGELGDGTTISRSTPDVPVLSLTGGVAISGTCALLTTTGMSCWGPGGGGALGDGLGTDSNVPVDVLGLTKISAISASGDHTCGISSGSVYCWGFNAFGQCGDGRQARNLYSPPATGVQSNAATVGAGSHHSCALLNTGRVRCWGENYNGEVGDGTTVERDSPVDVVGLSGVASLAVGSVHNCALLTSGAIRCWGSNAFGQLGDGTFTNRSTPVDIPWMCP
jgi:alpha-tubulin suppressor-like RCC1 family protein